MLLHAACSFMCYQCGPKKDGEEYTTEQCEKDQKKVNCTGDDNTCIKFHGKRTNSTVFEKRECIINKSDCELIKKDCADDDKKKVAEMKECEVACCVSDGDTPCNSGFTVSAKMIMMMCAVLCSLKMF